MISAKSRIVVSKRLRRCRGGDNEGYGGTDSVDGDDDVDDETHHVVLNLMIICCEEKAPYGPAEETANMFLELLCAAYEQYQKDNSSVYVDNECTAARTTIRITIYHAQQMDYPQTSKEWDSYDGIIIPGSLSAAYDTHIEWIQYLMTMIQTEIHANRSARHWVYAALDIRPLLIRLDFKKQTLRINIQVDLRQKVPLVQLRVENHLSLQQTSGATFCRLPFRRQKNHINSYVHFLR